MSDALLATRHGVVTALGRRRDNEDSYLAEHPIYVVADGMGGYEAGELASQAAVAAFADLRGRSTVSPDDVADRLALAAREVSRIPVRGQGGAGTTVAVVAACEQDGEPYWLVANLGDSRVYRRTSGQLHQVSVDHSEVQEMVDSGRISPAEARSHPRRHVVTRALGPHGFLEPDYWLLPVEAGDRMLLCSDGLTGEVDDTTIDQILAIESDPQGAAEALVVAALRAGGRDNITVVVVDARLVSDAVGVADAKTAPIDLDEDADRTLPRAGVLSGGDQ